MSGGFEAPWSLPLWGLAIGLVLGALARATHFCTLAALERHWYSGDSRGLRVWMTMTLTAIIATQLLGMAGAIDTSAILYLSAPFNPLASVLGGLAFGLGMAMVGTCGLGALVQLGGGNLKALVVVTTIGLSALATQRGVLGVVREHVIEPLAIGPPGGSQSLPLLAERLSGFAIGHVVVTLVIIAFAAWILRERAFRRDIAGIATGTGLGALVAAGWWMTTQGAMAQLRPVAIEGASFVRPPAELLFHLTIQTGLVPRYSVGLVLGVVVGAVLVAARRHDMRWEACDSARELGRHLAGATLMGIGGVLALGCTIGQGVSAFSVLALSAPITFVSMLIGARIGLSWLLGDDSLYRRFRPDRATERS